MHAVFSYLDHKHEQLLEDLWAELARKFPVREFSVTPVPHIAYQAATHYNVRSLQAALRRFAASKTSFQIRASGLGIFPGPHPVLYIPIVRSPEFTQFHEALWQEISSTGSGFVDYYQPAHWMPHITIGMHDMNKDNLSRIVPFLADRNFNWEMTVDNIALTYSPIVPFTRTTTSRFVPFFRTTTSRFALACENHSVGENP